MHRLRLTPGQLRTRLLLLATLTVLPALVVIAGSQWFARQRALIGTIEENRRLARLAAEQQAVAVTGTERLLHTLVAGRVAHHPDECSTILADVQRDHPDQAVIFILDRQGRQACGPAGVAVGTSFGDRPWFRAAIASSRVEVGDFQISRVSGQPAIVMALADAEVDHVYGASVQLRQLEKIAATAQLPTSAILTVLDRHATILVRYPDGDRWVGQQLRQTIAMDRIRHGATDDVREDVSADGLRRLWTTVPISTTADARLVLGLGVPDTIAFAAANDTLRRSAILLVAVIAATMMIAWVAGDAFFFGPIAALSDVLHRLADGDLTARAELATAIPGVPQLTAAVNQMADALESRARERDEAQARLTQAQKMEAIGRLAGGIAHDFNNLLTIIVGATEMVRDKVGPNEDIDQIRTAATSAAALTRQLLAFSRKQVLTPQVIDLNAIVARVGALVRRTIGENVRLTIAPAATPCPVYADPHQMEQVVLNLAVNARDAMPRGGTLTIATSMRAPDEAPSAANRGGFAVLTVSDTGGGISDEAKAHLFEPFFTTKETGKGTGLGLATVYGIVEQSGGTIEVDTALGLGTTFRVVLPLKPIAASTTAS